MAEPVLALPLQPPLDCAPRIPTVHVLSGPCWCLRLPESCPPGPHSAGSSRLRCGPPASSPSSSFFHRGLVPTPGCRASPLSHGSPGLPPLGPQALFDHFHVGPEPDSPAFPPILDTFHPPWSTGSAPRSPPPPSRLVSGLLVSMVTVSLEVSSGGAMKPRLPTTGLSALLSDHPCCGFASGLKEEECRESTNVMPRGCGLHIHIRGLWRLSEFSCVKSLNTYRVRKGTTVTTGRGDPLLFPCGLH